MYCDIGGVVMVSSILLAGQKRAFEGLVPAIGLRSKAVSQGRETSWRLSGLMEKERGGMVVDVTLYLRWDVFFKKN